MESDHRDRAPSPPPQARGDEHDLLTWLLNNPLQAFALLFLTFNVAVSARTSIGDPSTLSFVLFSYVDLLLLFFLLRKFEQLGPGDSPEKRRRMKAAVWLLTAALVLGFSWRVAGIMPWGLAAVVWVMGGSVIVAGFYGLFLHKEHM
ncbi:unnamed protein product [Musa hybrid cultivar]